MSDVVGRATSWLVLAMVLLAAFNAIARYLGRFLGVNLSSNAYLEAQWYIFSLIFLLCGGWALLRESHVRVDVLYSRLSDRARSWINIVGTALLLLPFSLFMLWVSWPSVRNSWIVREGSPDPGGLPRWPLKPLILFCFALVVLQGISQLIKEVNEIRTRTPGPERSQAEALEGM
jgi:TRAP-type mannitol/chloroaromatic compound transport system permease small subunit